MAFSASALPFVLRPWLYLCLMCCLFIFIAPSIAHAQSSVQQSTTSNSFSTPNIENDVPRDQHTWVQTVVIDVMSAVSCQLTGVDPTNPKQACLTTNPLTNKIGLAKSNSGLLGMVTGGIAMTLTPPVHTSGYIHYLANNFGSVNKAYAVVKCDSSLPGHGTGFCSLEPLMPVWIIIRNLAYLCFVVVFILIGFAIMLRIKLNPNTVVTVQNAIPKVIIGLLLITFSYAIAGFLIDIMYLSIAIFINLAASVDTGNDSISKMVNCVQGNNPIGFVNNLGNAGCDGLSGSGIGSLSWNTAGALGNAIGEFFKFDEGTKLIVGVVGGLIGAITGLAFGPLGAAVGLGVGFLGGSLLDTSNVVSTVGRLIGFIIIAVAIIMALIRIWIMLIKSYIAILLAVVFGPMWILASLVPKSKFTFTAWLRYLLANLAVFPTVIGMFLIAKVFTDLMGGPLASTDGRLSASNPGGLFVPPLIGSVGNADDMSGLLALGFILLAPTAIQMTRATFGSPEGKTLGTIGQGLAAGVGLVGGYAGGSVGKLFVGGSHEKPEGPIRTLYKLRAEEFAAKIQGKEMHENGGGINHSGSQNVLGRLVTKVSNPFSSERAKAIRKASIKNPFSNHH